MSQEGLIVKRSGEWVAADFTAEELERPGRVCIRFNNFWCLKRAGWQGEVGHDSRDHTKFSESAYAARAFFKTMRTYRYLHGLKSTSEIFNRYAPQSDCIGSLPRNSRTGECPNGENPSALYARNVAAALGKGPDEDIELFVDRSTVRWEVAKQLAKAVVAFELGREYSVTDALLRDGLKRANLEVAD